MPSDRTGRPASFFALRSGPEGCEGRVCARGFTLVEMLTVIAIIGILAALLITAVSSAMKTARVATAKADIQNLTQAATAYSLDFGAFPPDCTAFWTNGAQSQPDCPFPGYWSGQIAPYNASLSPNELLVWYLTTQYSTGQFNPATNSYLALGYPAGWTTNWPAPPPQWPADAAGDWTPSAASVVLSHGVNAGPYFDLKAKQKTDVNANGYYEFMDPWGRPYMYRAYPQLAEVTATSRPWQWPSPPAPPITPTTPWEVTLTLGNLASPTPPYGPLPSSVCNTYTYFSGYSFYTDVNLANTTGSIQLSGFTNPLYNGTFSFQGEANGTVILTFATNPQLANSLGYYSFPLHNKQSCDIYSLGPYGLTRAASSMASAATNNTAQEWKPTHGGTSVPGNVAANCPSLDPSSLDAWPQVWGTPGDGNDINSTSGNIIVNVLYQDNICNWQ